MTLWIIIMWTTLTATGASWVYLSTRLCKFSFIQRLTGNNEKRKALIGGGLSLTCFVLTGLFLNFMNAIVCLVYVALIWPVCDLFFWGLQKIFRLSFKRYYAGGAAVFLSFCALLCGWYLNHHVWTTSYIFETPKLSKDLKIVMFADSHIGTTFGAKGFSKHMSAIQKENPDAVVVVGDYVDDGTTKQDMIEATKALGALKTTYGVYFVFGNHDNGYYGPEHRGFSGEELVKELTKNGIKVLRDESLLIDNLFYLIGRKDYSVIREQGGWRKDMSSLVKDLNKDKYILVLDHQPTDYKAQAASGVDMVLSGHTHGGQLFPFNQVGKWIGANDRIYGHERRDKTDFIVTSGISDWAIKFKTGTKSEYVVITLSPKN